jgi:ubiquinone/menaquinone biosynthesis C-methylase UbiE
MSISFDRAVAYYDMTRGYRPDVAQAIGLAIVEAVGATPATRFLEIGVGTGRIALPIIALGFDYTGVDISRAMMDRLREKLAELERNTGRRPRATLLEADMQALPFHDGRFDAVIAAHVFHLVGDPDRAWQEAMRVLHAGGVLLVCGDASTSDEQVTIGETWRLLVREAYGPVPNSSEAAGRLIREQLQRDPHMRLDELRPVQWEFTVRPAEELEAIRQRLWSNTWVLPDEVFSRCFARLEAWTAEHFAGRMDEPVVRHAEFVIRRLRRDAGR